MREDYSKEIWANNVLQQTRINDFVLILCASRISPDFLLLKIMDIFEGSGGEIPIICSKMVLILPEFKVIRATLAL